MSQRIYTLILGALVVGNALAGDQVPAQPKTNRGFSVHEIWGEAMNGLQPYVAVSVHREDWGIEIGFLAQASFSEHTWLRVTNRSGSKLQLWLSSGVEIYSKNPSVLAASHLALQTTVSNFLSGVKPSKIRGMQWMRTQTQKISPYADFALQSAFTVSATNDVVLQITPLIYKVDTNQITARLIEFAPIKLKLLSTGGVEKVEKAP